MKRSALPLAAALLAPLALPSSGWAQTADSSSTAPSLIGDMDFAASEDPDGFRYEIPAEARTPSGLGETLDSERAMFARNFEQMRAEFARDNPDRTNAPDMLAWDKSWELMGRHGRLTSLGAILYTYEGGAHGNTAFDSMLWDSEGYVPMDFVSLFADRYGALAHLDRSFCTQLRAQQVERFEGETIDGLWAECPVLHEQAIIPAAGREGGPFSTVLVLVPPYIAGPYSMGSFEVSIPVDAALIAMLKPEYRDAFATH